MALSVRGREGFRGRSGGEGIITTSTRPAQFRYVTNPAGRLIARAKAQQPRGRARRGDLLE